jgi:phage tail-like protein
MAPPTTPPPTPAAELLPALKDPSRRPFTTFRFSVEVAVPGIAPSVCAATFSEVDGLEMSIEPKTIREGGNNMRPIHLLGPVSYGQLTLKRGMTGDLDLWKWFSRVTTMGYRGVRPDAEVVVFSSDGSAEDARFVLERCMPTKLKVPGLNAKDGNIAIEEMTLVYESLRLKQSTPDKPAPGSATTAGV